MCFGDVFLCLCGAGVLCAAVLVPVFSILPPSLRNLSLETNTCPPHHLLIRSFLPEQGRAIFSILLSIQISCFQKSGIHHSYPRTRSPSPIFNLQYSAQPVTTILFMHRHPPSHLLGRRVVISSAVRDPTLPSNEQIYS